MGTIVHTPNDTPNDMETSAKVVIKKEQRPGHSHIYADLPKKITFQVFNTKTKKLEPYGSMIWNGEEWEVEHDNKYHSIATMLNDSRGFGGDILTKKDREFYMPFYHTPTTGWRVDVEPIPVQYRPDKKE